jgi:hypothetical protein
MREHRSRQVTYELIEVVKEMEEVFFNHNHRKGDSFHEVYISSHPSVNPLAPYVAMLFRSFTSQQQISYLILCLKYSIIF